MFLTTLLIFLNSVFKLEALCGDSIRWSHRFDMDDVYGIWYGVGYAQHTPDMTNKPNEIGCVTLYITDITTEAKDDWLDWSIQRRNYTDQNWRSYKSNPWSDTSLSGSWLDINVMRKKRDMYDERRLRVVWDEDGQTMEQIYVYSPEAAGLWVTEQRNLVEKEMMARGIELWYPENPPRHPEVIRVLKVSPHMLIINHCSEIGDGGIFSLILRRLPSRMNKWEWYDLQKRFYSFDLPKIYRHAPVCSSCADQFSVMVTLMLVTLPIISYFYVIMG